MGLLVDAIELAKRIAEGAAEEGGKTLFTETMKRILPTARQRLVKRLLESLAELIRAEYRDNASLIGTAADDLDASLAEFLKNGGVLDLLMEPLYPNVTEVKSSYLGAAWVEMKLMSLPVEFDWSTVGKRYFKNVQRAVEEDPELRERHNAVTLQNVLAAIERSAPPDYGFQVARYRTRIHERYGYLKFDSFHVTGADVRRIALRQVFVAPDAKEDLPPLDLPKEELLRMVEEGEMDAQEVKATAGGRDHEEYKRRYQESPTRGVKELLGEARRAVVIGDPGSGKSSLLQEILLDWADQPDAKPFPLMVELRQCAMEKADWRGDFCKYFEVAADSLFKFNATELESYIRENPSVLLVDGLDEVFDPNERKRLTERVLNFAERFEKASVLVTSRKYGFQKDAWVNAAFRLFTLQDFTAPQRSEFLDRWHEQAFAAEPAEIARLKPRLKEAIAGYTPIRMLAGNPLLLTMMAVINRMEPVPRDRRALYERCADLLVHRWEVTLGRMSGPGDPEVQGALRTPLDLGDKKTLLELVAHEMQNTAGNLMAEERLKGLVTGFLQENCFDDCAGTARVIIEQLRGRNFILCSVGGARYAFVHRTFLEFFAARYYARRLEGAQVIEEVVQEHWRDERWHEVIRLVVAEREPQTETVRGVIRFLLRQDSRRARMTNVYLAADCVSDLRNPMVLGEDRGALIRAVWAGLEYQLDVFPRDPEEHTWESRARVAGVTRLAALVGLPALRQVLANPQYDSAVKAAAVQELARGWASDPETLPLLKDRARSNPGSYVQSAAVQELVRGWPDDPDTQELQRRAQNE